jgi:hypothetical protein
MGISLIQLSFTASMSSPDAFEIKPGGGLYRNGQQQTL